MVHSQNCVSATGDGNSLNRGGRGSPWLCSHCTIRRLFAQIGVLQPGTKSIKSV